VVVILGDLKTSTYTWTTWNSKELLVAICNKAR